MSEIWNSLIQCQERIIDVFQKNATEVFEEGMDRFNQPGWVNRVWENQAIRRAHIDVVDARDTRGLWMMHVCVFPVLSNDSPIYGFDVIAGKNKMTGAFLDFSPTVNYYHELSSYYQETVKDFVPAKKRELPEWAQKIFSTHMIAASNVNTMEEANSIIDLALETLEYYFDNVSRFNGTADDRLVTTSQNWYCHNQKLNPHTPRVMKSLGLNELDVDYFCKNMLFPETK